MADNRKGWLNQPEDNPRALAEEALIIEVSEAIWAALENKGMTKADLARALESSKANVTQLLDGRRNMTLRTLADIAFHLDLQPRFELCPKDVIGEWRLVNSGPIPARPRVVSFAPIETGKSKGWTQLLDEKKVA